MFDTVVTSYPLPTAAQPPATAARSVPGRPAEPLVPLHRTALVSAPGERVHGDQGAWLMMDGEQRPGQMGLVRWRMKRRAALLMAACAWLMVLGSLPVSASSTVAVVRGSTLGSRIFPDNFFTVSDKGQVSGRRLKFRLGIDY